MIYCDGNSNTTISTEWHIRCAYSNDLYQWTRNGTLFRDVDGTHDPMLFYDEKLSICVVFYTSSLSGDQDAAYGIFVPKLSDLINWSDNGLMIINCGKNGAHTFNTSACESPFVVRRGSNYYLFEGGWKNYITKFFLNNDNNPFEFDSVTDGTVNSVGTITTDAVIRGSKWKLAVSSCGCPQGGVYLMPLYWFDGLNNETMKQHQRIHHYPKIKLIQQI